MKKIYFGTRDYTPQTLLDTMLWICGMYFTMRSFDELRMYLKEVEMTDIGP